VIAVTYELSCDPHGDGEEFAAQIEDACLSDTKAIVSAVDGLIVAVKQLDGTIIDMSTCDETIVEDLLGLPDGQVDRLRAALVEYDLVITEHMAPHDAETVRLANRYKAACDAVQPVWDAMLATLPVSPERTDALNRYLAAQRYALECHKALIAHASGGVAEVGQ
jgi:hypothetical protein